MYDRSYQAGWIIRNTFREILVGASIEFVEGRSGVFRVRATLAQHAILEQVGI